MKFLKYKITVRDLVWFIVCLLIIGCFLVGVFVCNDDLAMAVISGASTAVSTVLSIVAILYTMIEGANSASINSETVEKINQIDQKLQDLSNMTEKFNEVKSTVNDILPQIDSVLKNIESKTSITDYNNMFDDETKRNIARLRSFMVEDIDD